jgi:hypothetical protein
MAEEETTQTEVEQPTTQTDEQERIGEETGSTYTGTESGTTASESQEDWQRRYEEGNRKLTEMGQTNAQLQQQQQFLQTQIEERNRALGQLGGYVQQQQDPEQAAWQRYQTAQSEYNQEEQNRALLDWTSAREQKMRQSIQAEAIKASQVQQSLPRAAEMLGIKDINAASQQLAQIYQNITPEDLAVIGAYRNGTLPEKLTKQQEARDAAARQAEYLASVSTGGGRVVPGLGHQAQATHRYELDNWLLLAHPVREQLLKGGVEVRNLQGEVMSNPPM